MKIETLDSTPESVIRKAQDILAEYIVPDSGISDRECINRLLGLLDGSECRAALSRTEADKVKS